MTIGTSYNENDYATVYSTEQETVKDQEQEYPDRNWKYTIVSKVGYLLGLPKEYYDSGINYELSEYELMNKNKQARIIRNLNIIRTSIFKNNLAIYTAMQRDYKNLSSLPEYIPAKALRELYDDGIKLEKTNYKLNNYSIDINNHIKNHINNCKDLFPSWINWNYLKTLFIIPDGSTEAGVAAASRAYAAKKKNYPYGLYINWPAAECGNVLYHDGRFVKLLYEANYDMFTDISKVRDATADTKTGIYEYLEKSYKAALIVDCENSDPYKLYAMLKNLDQKALKSKINEIILFDDFHTTDAWKILEEFTDIPVTYKQIDRIKENKSLVDQTLMITATKMVYKDEIDSFILAASDSDYWALIKELPDTNFLVVIEDLKCGPDIKEALSAKGIRYCSLDEFCTGDIGDIKKRMLLKEMRLVLDDAVNINLGSLLNEAIERTRMQLTQDEREAYYKRVSRDLRVDIDENGKIRLTL